MAKVAVSAGPLGGPPATQLPAVFQSPELGAGDHVALPAKVVLGAESKSSSVAAAIRKVRARRRARGVEQSEPSTPRCCVNTTCFIILGRESGVIVELDYIEPPLLNRANWEAKTDIGFIAVGWIACCCC